jgi:nucleotide-binding universal stress UspA family protein
MYKRIMIPTDGSTASERAVSAGIALAKAVNADVIGVTVTPRFHLLAFAPAQLNVTEEEFDAANRDHAQRLLRAISEVAGAQGVDCTCEHVVADHPFQAIIDTAREHQCDLINMASHGRTGLSGLLLGSQTQKVLVHSAIPVLVHR